MRNRSGFCLCVCLLLVLLGVLTVLGLRLPSEEIRQAVEKALSGNPGRE